MRKDEEMLDMIHIASYKNPLSAWFESIHWSLFKVSLTYQKKKKLYKVSPLFR